MVKIISIVILVLSLILFPPAALALVSNNAVPGDATYPIKRGLEDVIYAVVSIHPSTKALFAKARSDRRFQEITVLLTQGKEATQTLNELVEQTQTAADQINLVSDLNARKEMIKKLQDSIAKYDEGLSKASQIKPKVSKPVPPATPLPTSASVVLQPIVTPGPTIAPAPNPRDEEIDKTLEELERIRRELELQRQELMKVQNQAQNESVVATPTPKPTPGIVVIPKPTPTPTLHPTPYPTRRPAGVSVQSLDEGMINQAATEEIIDLLTTPEPKNISSDSSQTTPPE